MVKLYQTLVTLFSVGLFIPSQAAPSNLEAVSCVLIPNSTVELASPVAGVVAELLVERGSRVKKGDIVVSLSKEVELAEVELARARSRFAARSVERNESLVAGDLMSAQERDQMETERYLASLEFKRAQRLLAQKTVFSPIDGIVLNVPISVGEVVGVGSADQVATLVSLDPLKVEIVFDAKYYGALNIGDIVSLRLSRMEGFFAAAVEVIDPLIDPASDTFGVRLNLPNPEKVIPAGLRCALAD